MQNDIHKDIENLLSAMYADQIKGFTSEQRERLIQTLAEAREGDLDAMAEATYTYPRPDYTKQLHALPLYLNVLFDKPGERKVKQLTKMLMTEKQTSEVVDELCNLLRWTFVHYDDPAICDKKGHPRVPDLVWTLRVMEELMLFAEPEILDILLEILRQPYGYLQLYELDGTLPIRIALSQCFYEAFTSFDTKIQKQLLKKLKDFCLDSRILYAGAQAVMDALVNMLCFCSPQQNKLIVKWFEEIMKAELAAFPTDAYDPATVDHLLSLIVLFPEGKQLLPLAEKIYDKCFVPMVEAPLVEDMKRAFTYQIINTGLTEDYIEEYQRLLKRGEITPYDIFDIEEDGADFFEPDFEDTFFNLEDTEASDSDEKPTLPLPFPGLSRLLSPPEDEVAAKRQKAAQEKAEVMQQTIDWGEDEPEEVQINLSEAEVHPSLAKVSNSSLKPSEPIRVFNPNVQIIDRKVGRNEPCPCGSGKKYKNCCGK